MCETTTSESDNFAVHCRALHYDEDIMKDEQQQERRSTSPKQRANRRSQQHKRRSHSSRSIHRSQSSRSLIRKVSPKIVDVNLGFLSSFENLEDWQLPFQKDSAGSIGAKSSTRTTIDCVRSLTTSPKSRHLHRHRHSSLRDITKRNSIRRMRNGNAETTDSSSPAIFEVVGLDNFFERPCSFRRSRRNVVSKDACRSGSSRRLRSPSPLTSSSSPDCGFSPASLRQAKKWRRSVMTTLKSSRNSCTSMHSMAKSCSVFPPDALNIPAL